MLCDDEHAGAADWTTEDGGFAVLIPGLAVAILAMGWRMRQGAAAGKTEPGATTSASEGPSRSLHGSRRREDPSVPADSIESDVKRTRRLLAVFLHVLRRRKSLAFSVTISKSAKQAAADMEQYRVVWKRCRNAAFKDKLPKAPTATSPSRRSGLDDVNGTLTFRRQCLDQIQQPRRRWSRSRPPPPWRRSSEVSRDFTPGPRHGSFSGVNDTFLPSLRILPASTPRIRCFKPSDGRVPAPPKDDFLIRSSPRADRSSVP